MRDIAQAIGRRLNLPVASKSAEKAADHFGWLVTSAELDRPASSEKTQARLGWKPKQITGLLADIERSTYFTQ